MHEDVDSAAAGDFVLSPSDRMVLCGQFCIREGIRQAGLLQGPSTCVTLNETAAEILKRCEGPCSVAHIVDDFKALYVGASTAEIERAVREFLDVAYRKGWVKRSGEGSPEPPVKPAKSA